MNAYYIITTEDECHSSLFNYVRLTSTIISIDLHSALCILEFDNKYLIADLSLIDIGKSAYLKLPAMAQLCGKLLPNRKQNKTPFETMPFILKTILFKYTPEFDIALMVNAIKLFRTL